MTTLTEEEERQLAMTMTTKGKKEESSHEFIQRKRIPECVLVNAITQSGSHTS